MFLKPNALIYVRRSGLVIAGKHITPARLSFPVNVVDNLEILDSEQFVELCRQFFADNDLHGKRILAVLDDTCVFEKTVNMDKAGKPDKLLAAFVAAMPFEPGQRSCLGVNGDNQLKLYATNAQLCKGLNEAVKQAGAGKLLAITPAAAYGLAPDQPLSTAVTTFITDTTVRGRADLSSVSPA